MDRIDLDFRESIDEPLMDRDRLLEFVDTVFDTFELALGRRIDPRWDRPSGPCQKRSVERLVFRDARVLLERFLNKPYRFLESISINRWMHKASSVKIR